MLESTVILNPFGMNTNKKTLSQVKIANIKTNVDGTSDYVYLIHEPESTFGDEIFIHGVIRNHDRNNPVSFLMKKIYEDFGNSSCETSEISVNEYWKE